MRYREIVESSYRRDDWLAMLSDVFHGRAEFQAAPPEVPVGEQLARQALLLGMVPLAEGARIAVYEVELAEGVRVERNRRGVRELFTADWRARGCAGALTLAHRPSEDALRFSYVSEGWKFNEQGHLERVSTDTQRCTYLLGKAGCGRTAAEQLEALRSAKPQSLAALTAAFSVEPLTRQFYRDLFGWFQWAVSPQANVSFPDLLADAPSEGIETKIIRLITRLMFVWFIKQKDLVPQRIFDAAFLATILKDFDPYSATDGNYYNAILQNLFFGTLNRAIVDEKGNSRQFAALSSRDVKTLYRYAEMFSIGEREVINLFAEVPFLNGGLFECLDRTRRIDGVEQCYSHDGFSRNALRLADGRWKHRATVPNNLFFDPEKGLLPILSRYHFTVEENSPEEQQVALDPELLGRVFENLLGAYNPETKETARNQSGSFYTPREIVNYMVDESLVAYLGDSDFTRSLFRSDFSLRQSDAEQCRAAADKLRALKVLDPACGSGAFPVGLLNRMVEILERIFPDASVYDLKLSIIENCLYGCDIQCIAVQITKLRFFISLICDCERDPAKPNFGIPTLPNLETKFVAADSLIAKKKRSMQRNILENLAIEPTKSALEEVRHRHFAAKAAAEKQRLREEDRELREKLVKLIAENDSYQPEDARQLAAWNPYDQNAVSPFFDPEWMFGVVDGFDIVIGNPPYIQLQSNAGELAKRYQNCNFSTFARTGDIYCLFYERGWQLLKDNGHLCYITSNKWMRAGYGEKIREFLTSKTNPIRLIDFAGVKVFESATVDTNILLFAKAANQHNLRCDVVDRQCIGGVKKMSDSARPGGAALDPGGPGPWVPLPPAARRVAGRVAAAGAPLKEWGININYGIKTGLNDAFLIPTERREELLANCKTTAERQRTAELIRPILRGRDIRRYGYEWADLWLICIPWHFPYHLEGPIPDVAAKAERAFKELYPAVYSHMLRYKEPLLKRNKAEVGIRYEWYAMQRWGAKYWDDFFKPKIIWKRVGSNLRFSYDSEGHLGLDSTCFATGEHMKFLCCVLNSVMGHYLLKDSPKTGTGDLLVSVQAVEPIRVPYEAKYDGRLSYLLDRQLEGASDTVEKEINDIVFTMYGLSSEEREYVTSCVNRLWQNQ